MPIQHRDQWMSVVREHFGALDGIHGGLNRKLPEGKLLPNQFSKLLNWIWTGGALRKRGGTGKLNSSPIAGNPSLASLFQFRPSTGVHRLFAQGSDDDIYYSDNGGAGWTKVDAFNGTSGGSPACWAQYRDTFFITNGNDFPQVGTLDEAPPLAVLRTNDSGSTFIDYSDEARDSDTATHAALDGLNVWDGAGADDQALYVSFSRNLSGVVFTIDDTNKNATASTLSVNYYNGAWAPVSNLSDGTASAGATMAQSGTVSWTLTTDSVQQTINGITGHWYRFTVSTRLSATVDVTGVRVNAPIQKIQNLWSGEYEPVHGCYWHWGDPYTDILAEVVDDVSVSGANVGGMNGPNLYVGFMGRVRGFRFQFVHSPAQEVNVNAVTLGCQYWRNDGTWADLAITDGTTVNGSAFAQDGDITFQWPADAEKRTVGGGPFPMHWFRFSASAPVSSPATISGISAIPELELDTDWKFRFCAIFKSRLFLARSETNPNYLFFSAAKNPEVFDGEDAGFIEIGPGYPIQWLMAFYNELAVGLSDGGGVYILQGYSPATFGLLRISSADCISPKSAAIVDLRDKGGGEFGFFLARDGFYRVEGTSCVKISDPLDPYFDPTSLLHLDFASAHMAAGAVYRPKNWYVCAVPLRGGTPQATNNYWFVYDYVQGSWFLFDISSASVQCILDGNRAERLVFGGIADGTLWMQSDAYTSDDSTAIDADLEHPDALGDPYLVKCVRQLDIRTSCHGSGADELSLSVYQDGSSAEASLCTVDLVNSAGDFQTVSISTDLQNLRHLKLRIRHNSVNPAPEIYGWRWLFEALRGWHDA
ncbi:MAG: hypothetical protein JRI22_13975 [Deltaproteobacteria bacterium]|nr:hypothetical protein [Deltaproteobacteria bacterium]